jgi:hypothetical protein
MREFIADLIGIAVFVGVIFVLGPYTDEARGFHMPNLLVFAVLLAAAAALNRAVVKSIVEFNGVSREFERGYQAGIRAAELDRVDD